MWLRFMARRGRRAAARSPAGALARLALLLFLAALLPVSAARAQPAPPLVAVIAVADPAQMLPPGTHAAGIDLSRLAVPEAPGLVARLAALLGAPIDGALVARLRDAVTAHYESAGHPFVDVGLPEQDVTEGVVQLVITEFRLGTLRVEGNAWFDAALIRARSGLLPGEVIDKAELDRRIARLGASPFLSVTPEFSPGQAVGTTDAVLRVADRLPLEFSVASNKTGSPETGWERVVLGVTWGNFLGLGQTLGWQFTTSADFWHDRGAHEGRERPPGFVGQVLTWEAPLPWGATLGASAGLMRQTPQLGPDLGSRGRTIVAGLTYAMPLGPLGLAPHPGSSQQLTLAYDFKRTNNYLSFGGSTVQSGYTDVSQFTARYALQLPDPLGLTDLLGSLVLSPGDMTTYNTDADYQPGDGGHAGTPGASARYAYARLALTRTTPLPAGFELLLRGTGQLASGNLLPSEQLSLAGIDAVRGYQEFGVIAATGALLTAELRLPRLSPASLLPAAGVQDGLRPHLFLDLGQGWNPTPSSATPAYARTAGIGVGLRYDIGRALSLRLEQGWQLLRAPRQAAGSPFLLFALSATW